MTISLDVLSTREGVLMYPQQAAEEIENGGTFTAEVTYETLSTRAGVLRFPQEAANRILEIAASSSSSSSPSLLTDLIAYYRFNGDGSDSSSNGNDLTIDSGTLVPGKINGALQEGFAEAATVVQTTGEVTISMWINIGVDAEDTAAAGRVQVTDGLNFIRLTQSSRNGSAIVAEFRVSDGSTEQFVENIDVSVTSDTQWLNVVGVMPVDGQMYLYVNGVYNNASVVPFPFEISSIQVNSIPDAVSKVGDVGIWNRALSESEILQLYNSGNGYDPTA